jgi:hypothetical protein
MITNKIKTVFFLASLLFAFGLTGNVKAANFPLEITNIKPAGTGAPAIPATNRIFRAYPGIEYNIRAAVIGGTYPYTYSLSNTPEGMTINSRTGEIIWPNPQTDATNIQLSVKDSENTTVSTTWSIAVSTNGFLFVDASYSGVEAGSIEQPYSSLANFLTATLNKNLTDIVYFRGGAYLAPAHNSSAESRIALITGKPAMRIDANPTTWLGYPGETVNINVDGRFITCLSVPMYFDSLNLYDFSDYGINVSSDKNYMTIRRCKWSNIVAVDSANHNQSFFFTWDNGVGNYLVIQDNEYRDFTGTMAIGSLYRLDKFLIENNYIHSNGGGGLTGMNHAIMLKLVLNYGTVRGNRVITDGEMVVNGMLYGSDNTEICFNYLYNLRSDTGRGITAYFNTEGHTVNGAMRALYFHRNTVVGDLLFRFIRHDDCAFSGPYNLYNSIIINPNQDYSSYWNTYNFLSFNPDGSLTPEQRVARRDCINEVNNIKSTTKIVDLNGNLTSSHSEYLGTHGWQFSDGSTPMDKTTSLPADPIPGDINKDGVVNIFDYNIFLQHFGVVEDCQNSADLNGDCAVNIFDYNVLLQNFGRTQ